MSLKLKIAWIRLAADHWSASKDWL